MTLVQGYENILLLGAMRALQVFFNYWEVNPSAIGNALEQIYEAGCRDLVAFVPWHAFETDLQHRLARFLDAALEKGFSVSLSPVPEPGINFPNAGLPADVIGQTRNLAQDRHGANFVVAMPPRIFPLPSLASAEVGKRLDGFLSRLHVFLADYEHAHPKEFRRVSLTLTGSFWKYYRGSVQQGGDIGCDTFRGETGDCTQAFSQELRTATEQFFSFEEFIEPDPVTSERWRSRTMEPVNRRWTRHFLEEAFRLRCQQHLCKQGLAIDIDWVELFCPEADPNVLESQLLAHIVSGAPDFERLGRVLTSAMARVGSAGEYKCRGAIVWSSQGAWFRLRESERQFLLLKSLLIAGSSGGSVWLESTDWLALGRGFRSRVENLADRLERGEWSTPARVVYLSPELWGGACDLQVELERRGRGRVVTTASFEMLAHLPDTRVAVVDEQMILTSDRLKKLLKWSEQGRVLALPLRGLRTEACNRLVSDFRRQHKKDLEMELGVRYDLIRNGKGKVLFFQAPDFLEEADGSRRAWKLFSDGLCGLADLEDEGHVSDERLEVIWLAGDKADEKESSQSSAFVFNPGRRMIQAELVLKEERQVSDLGRELASARTDPNKPNGGPGVVTERVTLDVPPLGVVPLRFTKQERKTVKPERRPRAHQDEASTWI